jgi:hypothetical protein
MNPPENATALTEPVTVELSDLEKATVEFTPERSNADLYVWCVAISKFSNSTYRVKFDGTEKYGPARFPPSDIDDKGVVWLPPERVDRSITVEVTNLLTDGQTREYYILPLGWEESNVS